MQGELHTKIAECIKSNPKAQMYIYNLYAKGVYNASLRVLGDSTTAEEITQDAFLTVFRQMQKYLECPEKLQNSIRRIAINRSIDHLRRKKIITQDISPIEYKTSLEEPAQPPNPEKLQSIYTAINKLSQGYKAILTLKVIEELPTEDIAQQLNITPSTVRTQLKRAKQKVLDIIKQTQQ